MSVRVGAFSDAVSGRTPEAMARRMRRAYESSSVESVAVAAYANIFDASPDRRQANRGLLDAPAASGAGSGAATTWKTNAQKSP